MRRYKQAIDREKAQSERRIFFLLFIGERFHPELILYFTFLFVYRFRERSELTPYMQTLNYMDYTADQVKDLMFDRTKFRADRQVCHSDPSSRQSIIISPYLLIKHQTYGVRVLGLIMTSHLTYRDRKVPLRKALIRSLITLLERSTKMSTTVYIYDNINLTS